VCACSTANLPYVNGLSGTVLHGWRSFHCCHPMMSLQMHALTNLWPLLMPGTEYGCYNPLRDVVASSYEGHLPVWFNRTRHMTVDEIMARKKRYLHNAACLPTSRLPTGWPACSHALPAWDHTCVYECVHAVVCAYMSLFDPGYAQPKAPTVTSYPAPAAILCGDRVDRGLACVSPLCFHLLQVILLLRWRAPE